MKKVLLMAFAVFGLSFSQANADPVTWTIEGFVVVEDAGFPTEFVEFAGTFIYDADTDLLYDLSILDVGGEDYTSLVSWTSSGFLSEGDVYGDTLIADFDDALTNFGGTIALFGLVNVGNSEDQYSIGGNVSALVSSVPEPATLGIMASGLLGLLALRRRKHI